MASYATSRGHLLSLPSSRWENIATYVAELLDNTYTRQTNPKGLSPKGRSRSDESAVGLEPRRLARRRGGGS